MTLVDATPSALSPPRSSGEGPEASSRPGQGGHPFCPQSWRLVCIQFAAYAVRLDQRRWSGSAIDFMPVPWPFSLMQRKCTGSHL